MTDETTGSAPSEDISTPEPQFEATPMDAVERAFASLDEDTGQDRTEPDSPQKSADVKPEPEGQKRGPDGKFIAKEPEGEPEPTDDPQEGDEQEKEPVEAEVKTPFSEPPSRFSAEAKEAWKDAPDTVKAEIHRAVSEMEAGIEKHRQAAQEWDNLSEFSELAKANNVTVKDAMARYVAADQHLNRDLLGGLDALAKQYGSSLHDIAAHVLNQPADQVQSQSAAEVRGLNDKIARLEQQLTSVTTNIQQQQTTATQREVETFAASNPRFEELADAIKQEIQYGYDLPTAYARADRLNPAPQAPVVAAPAAPDLAAQTRKGSLSVSGAPSSGSNPANRKPPSTPMEALDRAFAQAGLG